MSAIPAIPLEKQPIEYPTSDGKPMAETTLHRVVMQDLIHGLTGKLLPWPDEEAAVRQAAEERTRILEAENARLRAELERRQG